MYRIAINGYGRIGQCVLRALYENKYRNQLKIVVINDLADVETLSYLTKYDTTHGRFQLPVEHTHNKLIVNNDTIDIMRKSNIDDIDWKPFNLDLLIECSGSFKDIKTAQTHIQKGAKKLLFSNPAQPNVDKTIIYGINHHTLNSQDAIISGASCTTNCIIPVLKILDDKLKINYGSMTTIHSAMNDQPIIDTYHKTDLRLTRSALQSIIPVKTFLDTGIDRLIPKLKGRFSTNAIRVPTINVSCIDACFHVEKATTVEDVNQLISHISNTSLKSILDVTTEPKASIDFNHDAKSCIVDLTQTKVTAQKLIKLLCWFDNEWGYANRMLDISSYWLNQ